MQRRVWCIQTHTPEVKREKNTPLQQHSSPCAATSLLMHVLAGQLERSILKEDRGRRSRQGNGEGEEEEKSKPA